MYNYGTYKDIRFISCRKYILYQTKKDGYNTLWKVHYFETVWEFGGAVARILILEGTKIEGIKTSKRSTSKLITFVPT